MQRVAVKRISALILLSFSLVFCLFILSYERRAQSQSQNRVEEHARVIAEALWNYNHQSYFEYLTLACESDYYERIWIVDALGEKSRATNHPVIGSVC